MAINHNYQDRAGETTGETNSIGGYFYQGASGDCITASNVRFASVPYGDLREVGSIWRYEGSIWFEVLEDSGRRAKRGKQEYGYCFKHSR